MPRKKTTPSSKTTNAIDFEKSIDKLTLLVEKLEHGNLPLEQSLKYYEEGIALVRQCQTALNQAEQKIQILTAENNGETLQPYHLDDNDE